MDSIYLPYLRYKIIADNGKVLVTI